MGQIETGTEGLERGTGRLQLALRAAPFAVFEQGAGEQCTRAGPVVGGIRVAPEIRGSPQALDRTCAVAFGEEHRPLSAVRGGPDQLAVTGITDVVGTANVYSGDERIGAAVRLAYDDAVEWVARHSGEGPAT